MIHPGPDVGHLLELAQSLQAEQKVAGSDRHVLGGLRRLLPWTRIRIRHLNEGPILLGRRVLDPNPDQLT